MTGISYQELAMITNDGKCTDRLIKWMEDKSNHKFDLPFADPIDFGGVLNACLGLAGEVGEVNDIIKKHIFHEQELDEEHLQEEIGDVLWYIVLICTSYGFDVDEIMYKNVKKIINRYPEGFDIERANNRKENDV